MAKATTNNINKVTISQTVTISTEYYRDEFDNDEEWNDFLINHTSTPTQAFEILSDVSNVNAKISSYLNEADKTKVEYELFTGGKLTDIKLSNIAF